MILNERKAVLREDLHKFQLYVGKRTDSDNRRDQASCFATSLADAEQYLYEELTQEWKRHFVWTVTHKKMLKQMRAMQVTDGPLILPIPKRYIFYKLEKPFEIPFAFNGVIWREGQQLSVWRVAGLPGYYTHAGNVARGPKVYQARNFKNKGPIALGLTTYHHHVTGVTWRIVRLLKNDLKYTSQICKKGCG